MTMPLTYKEVMEAIYEYGEARERDGSSGRIDNPFLPWPSENVVAARNKMEAMIKQLINNQET